MPRRAPSTHHEPSPGKRYVALIAGAADRYGRPLTLRELGRRMRCPWSTLGNAFYLEAGYTSTPGRGPGGTMRLDLTLDDAIRWLAADLSAVIPDPADRRDFIAELSRRLGISIAMIVPFEGKEPA